MKSNCCTSESRSEVHAHSNKWIFCFTCRIPLETSNDSPPFCSAVNLIAPLPCRRLLWLMLSFFRRPTGANLYGWIRDQRICLDYTRCCSSASSEMDN
ncbi:unnamed protein product [Protopolystoma xenopodis]|uniref:Uncharacterized protein n=1 Tax=Protopolystoma xenopodis TaxID=117903 RepID=A0A3S5B925_9PLAT|nr:unnamed protein product [Protopolystoma xenopodis]